MPKFKPLPSFERVQELLSYDSETGNLYWKQSVTRWIKPGDKAGSRSRHAVDVTVDKKSYRAHRIIWLLKTASDPGDNLIDHIDGNPFNNKFANLRLATHRQNQCNQRRRSDNTSGLKGVHWNKERRKWVAQISRNGKIIPLGRYATKEQAHAAYCQAVYKFNGEFACLE